MKRALMVLALLVVGLAALLVFQGTHHALLDLVGLDTSLAILDALYAEFRDPNFAAAPALRRMVAAGQLGRKTKQGFRSY